MKLFAEEKVWGLYSQNSKTVYGKVMKINIAMRSCYSFLKIENNIFQMDLPTIPNPENNRKKSVNQLIHLP